MQPVFSFTLSSGSEIGTPCETPILLSSQLPSSTAPRQLNEAAHLR